MLPFFNLFNIQGVEYIVKKFQILPGAKDREESLKSNV